MRTCCRGPAGLAWQGAGGPECVPSPTDAPEGLLEAGEPVSFLTTLLRDVLWHRQALGVQ